MLHLRNSNQDPPVDLYNLEASDEGDIEIDSLTKEPSDTLLMGDEVISITLERENDKFIKSSVDDLVPILRESKVTLVCDDLECDMPVNTPLPITDVREEYFDINSPLGEQVVDFLMENVDVAGSLRTLVVWTPPELTPVIDESILLVTPLPDSKEISLREVERLDPFFSLTQSGGKTRVMETLSFSFHHMPSPRPTAYSPKEIPSDESKVYIEVLSMLWENRLPIPDGSLPLSRNVTPDPLRTNWEETLPPDPLIDNGKDPIPNSDSCTDNTITQGVINSKDLART
ncbi:hypothetical protein Tco_0315821 [Tanacetum coccineum]